MKPTGNFFSEEIAIFDARKSEFLQKFENNWLDQLIEKWWRYYFARQNETTNESEFKNKLRLHIQDCVDYLRIKKTQNNWNQINRIHWIEETYKELLYDNGDNIPKQEALIEQVGARWNVQRILDWIQGK